MKILVVGSGGREHAIAWKMLQSPRVQKVFVAPGNGGTATEQGLENLPIRDLSELAHWARSQQIDLTVVGPEAPLAAGIVDLFRSQGLRIFGPTQQAAQLESSKAFSKDFMVRHGIPTATHETFTQAEAAHAHVDRLGAPIVVKADGLAAGKGVVVAQTLEQAHAAIDDMLQIQPGIQASDGVARVVIEACLVGEEASFMVVTDGADVVPLATSQDHKRLLDHDQGPNTGGMGAYSPAKVVTPAIHARVMREVIYPTIEGMKKDGIPFSGFLYAGLMIGADGSIKTLEFNARLGDPETQPLMMRLRSDLFELLWAATDPKGGKLKDLQLDWDRRTALGVVMASEGYPASPVAGDVVTLAVKVPADVKVFHAGTSLSQGHWVTAGGRVLCVTALGEGVRAAQHLAYEAIQGVAFRGMQFRRDIGFRALSH